MQTKPFWNALGRASELNLAKELVRQWFVYFSSSQKTQRDFRILLSAGTENRTSGHASYKIFKLIQILHLSSASIWPHSDWVQKPLKIFSGFSGVMIRRHTDWEGYRSALVTGWSSTLLPDLSRVCIEAIIICSRVKAHNAWGTLSLRCCQPHPYSHEITTGMYR